MSVSLDIDFNIILNLIAAVGGLVAAIVSWFCVRPADKKLVAVEALLQQNNERMSSMRKVLLDSSTRSMELKYAKLVESCEAVYKSFMKIYGASCGLLAICSEMKDLNEIRIVLQRENKLDRIREWLGLFVTDEMLHPIKLDDLSVAEIHAPERVWRLYNAASLLCASAIMQMAALKNGLDVQLVKCADVYSSVDQAIPGCGEKLKEFGTSEYRSTINLIKNVLIAEIRTIFENGPITDAAVIAVNERFDREMKIPPIPEDIRQVVGCRGV